MKTTVGSLVTFGVAVACLVAAQFVNGTAAPEGEYSGLVDRATVKAVNAGLDHLGLDLDDARRATKKFVAVMDALETRGSGPVPEGAKCGSGFAGNPPGCQCKDCTCDPCECWRRTKKNGRFCYYWGDRGLGFWMYWDGFAGRWIQFGGGAQALPGQQPFRCDGGTCVPVSGPQSDSKAIQASPAVLTAETDASVQEASCGVLGPIVRAEARIVGGTARVGAAVVGGTVRASGRVLGAVVRTEARVLRGTARVACGVARGAWRVATWPCRLGRRCR